MHSRGGVSTKQEGKMVFRMSEVSELLPPLKTLPIASTLPTAPSTFTLPHANK